MTSPAQIKREMQNEARRHRRLRFQIVESVFVRVVIAIEKFETKRPPCPQFLFRLNSDLLMLERSRDLVAQPAARKLRRARFVLQRLREEAAK